VHWVDCLGARTLGVDVEKTMPLMDAVVYVMDAAHAASYALVSVSPKLNGEAP
jgi:hypothetical protein